MGNAHGSCGRFRQRPASPGARPRRGPKIGEGDVVGRYDVCEKLGQGMGGGVVYRVRPRPAVARVESPASGDSATVKASPLVEARYDTPPDGRDSPEAGACDYDGNEFVALKYPVNREEEEFCQALQGQLCLGVPRIFDLGWHLEECYVVVQLLGSPVSKLFELLAPWGVADRWQVLRVLGRQMVRRLRAIHRLGFVHCDVNEGNILLGGEETWTVPGPGDAARDPGAPRGPDAAAEGPGEPRGPDGVEADDEAGAPEEALGCSPFLIDFGCARRFPDGEPMLPYWGSIDYTSINALTSECCRGPYDDLESLGWLLLHGLFGELPWNQWVQAAWSVNGRGEFSMMMACQQVRLAKVALLELGHGAFEQRWARLAELPADLRLYLRRCRAEAAHAAARPAGPAPAAAAAGRGGGGSLPPPRPAPPPPPPPADHEALLQILGGSGALDDHDAERLDVQALRDFGLGPRGLGDAEEAAGCEGRRRGGGCW